MPDGVCSAEKRRNEKVFEESGMKKKSNKSRLHSANVDGRVLIHEEECDRGVNSVE